MTKTGQIFTVFIGLVTIVSIGMGGYFLNKYIEKSKQDKKPAQNLPLIKFDTPKNYPIPLLDNSNVVVFGSFQNNIINITNIYIKIRPENNSYTDIQIAKIIGSNFFSEFKINNPGVYYVQAEANLPEYNILSTKWQEIYFTNLSTQELITTKVNKTKPTNIVSKKSVPKIKLPPQTNIKPLTIEEKHTVKPSPKIKLPPQTNIKPLTIEEKHIVKVEEHKEKVEARIEKETNIVKKILLEREKDFIVYDTDKLEKETEEKRKLEEEQAHLAKEMAEKEKALKAQEEETAKKTEEEKRLQAELAKAKAEQKERERLLKEQADDTERERLLLEQKKAGKELAEKQKKLEEARKAKEEAERKKAIEKKKAEAELARLKKEQEKKERKLREKEEALRKLEQEKQEQMVQDEFFVFESMDMISEEPTPQKEKPTKITNEVASNVLESPATKSIEKPKPKTKKESLREIIQRTKGFGKLQINIVPNELKYRLFINGKNVAIIDKNHGYSKEVIAGEVYDIMLMNDKNASQVHRTIINMKRDSTNIIDYQPKGKINLSIKNLGQKATVKIDGKPVYEITNENCINDFEMVAYKRYRVDIVGTNGLLLYRKFVDVKESTGIKVALDLGFKERKLFVMLKALEGGPAISAGLKFKISERFDFNIFGGVIFYDPIMYKGDIDFTWYFLIPKNSYFRMGLTVFCSFYLSTAGNNVLVVSPGIGLTIGIDWFYIYLKGRYSLLDNQIYPLIGLGAVF